MKTDFVRGIRRQVGWFVMLGIGAVVLVLMVISIRTDVFAKKFTLYVSPQSAASFYIGQPVKFQGFTIGRVQDIELQQEGRVNISLRLLERYRGMLHEGAKARLTKEGLIGQQVVEISAGDIQSPALRDRERVGYETEATIEQLLLDLKPAVANADTLLREMAGFAEWLNDNEGNVRLAMEDIRKISAGLAAVGLKDIVIQLGQTLADMQTVMNQMVENRVAEQLASSLKMTRQVLENVEPMTRSLGKTGPKTMAHVNRLMARLDKLTESLNVIAADLEELTPELPGLARETKSTIGEIQGLLRGLRGSWMFGDGGETTDGREENRIAPPALDMRP